MKEHTVAIVEALKAKDWKKLPQPPEGWEYGPVKVSPRKRELGVRGVTYLKKNPDTGEVKASAQYIVQNPEKHSKGAELARKGHFVVCVYKPVGVWKGLIVDGVWWSMGHNPSA